ncbi:hypothetical protein AB0D83_30980 [Streptomyces decoyicus]
MKTYSGARTRMCGTGNSLGRTSAYRWEFDGTHIYGVEDCCLPSERAY